MLALAVLCIGLAVVAGIFGFGLGGGDGAWVLAARVLCFTFAGIFVLAIVLRLVGRKRHPPPQEL